MTMTAARLKNKLLENPMQDVSWKYLVVTSAVASAAGYATVEIIRYALSQRK